MSLKEKLNLSDDQWEKIVIVGKVILLWSLVALIALFCFTGCKSVQTVVEYRDHYVHDTTQVVDSVYQDRVHYVYQRGDTVFKTDSVFIYKYKWLDHNVIEQVHDSIPYPVEVEKVVYKRSGYDHFCGWFFWITIIVALLAAAWWAFKKFYLRK